MINFSRQKYIKKQKEQIISQNIEVLFFALALSVCCLTEHEGIKSNATAHGKCTPQICIFHTTGMAGCAAYSTRAVNV